MSVSTIINSITQAGNGVKVAFDFAFKILAATDLVVTKVDANGVEGLPLVLNSDYTVAFDSQAQTGTVTYSVAPVLNGSSKIKRKTDTLQSSVLPREGPMPAKTIETMADKLTLQVQDLAALVAAATTGIQVGVFSTLDAGATGAPFLAIVTDQRTFAAYLGDRTLGNNGWTTLGGF